MDQTPSRVKEDVTVKDPRVEAEEQEGVGDGMRSEQASSSRFQVSLCLSGIDSLSGNLSGIDSLG